MGGDRREVTACKGCLLPQKSGASIGSGAIAFTTDHNLFLKHTHNTNNHGEINCDPGRQPARR